MITNLGHRQYSVRRSATEQLFQLLTTDYSQYLAVQAAITDPENSLECVTRLKYIRAAYFRHCFEAQYEVTKYRIPEQWGGGKRINPAYDLYVSMPRQFIWSLPREQRFIDDRDIAVECYIEGQAGLQAIELVPDPEYLNTDEGMRYATHVWLWNWLESGQDPAVANAILDDMLLKQDYEITWINRVAAERVWRGHIEITSPPLPIEDRLQLLTTHTLTPLPESILAPDGAFIAREPDTFDFQRFVFDIEKYVSGVLPGNPP